MTEAQAEFHKRVLALPGVVSVDVVYPREDDPECPEFVVQLRDKNAAEYVSVYLLEEEIYRKYPDALIDTDLKQGN